MINSKIILSPAQLELAANEQIILTKNAIIEAVENWLGELALRYQNTSRPYLELHPDVFTLQPKISKGEKQEGLPWVILDYPRRFSLPRGCFAVRTMFWWGKYLSIRVLLSGEWLKSVPGLQHQFPASIQGFTVNPFEVDVKGICFESENAEAQNMHYVLASVIPISQLHLATTRFEACFKNLLRVVCYEKA